MKKKLLLAAKVVGAIFGTFALAFGVLMMVTFWGVDDPVGGERVGVATTIDDGYVTCHFVEGDDGSVVLIDACVSDDAAAILAALEGAEHGPEAVTAILLTHGHADHRGGVAAFEDAELYAHRDELPLLRGEVRPRGPLPWWSGLAEPLEVTPVDDGEELELGGGISARAIHMPGHTSGSVAWLIGDTLFLGDAGVSRRSRVSGDPWVFSDDVDAAKRTLAALPSRLDAEGIDPEWLVFSHSAPLRGMEPLREFAENADAD
jgi:glyoxylase-like metal-dependent hydrolase (beta-lactamase superfamily II)